MPAKKRRSGGQLNVYLETEHMSTDDDQITEAGGTGSSALDHMSTWIELFYDLIFVAAILIFSTAVTHVHPSSGGSFDPDSAPDRGFLHWGRPTHGRAHGRVHPDRVR